MELVVADANVLFAGLIDRGSLYRTLLVVFAWAKAHEDLRGAAAYHEESEQLMAENPGLSSAAAHRPSRSSSKRRRASHCSKSTCQQ